MHRSSESIAALAAALAKAQSELSNPEKSLVATIGTDRPGEGARTFRYAPLSSGLDIVRKALGQHQIATVQSTAIDAATGTISLTTVLAHASGEWIASDWPVCRLGDSANPHRMGAALTYARRYTLFALVGIAGEDDLDAPDLGGAHQRPALGVGDGSKRGPGATSPYRPQGNGKRPRPPMLDAKSSAMLRDRLVGEIASIPSAEHGAEWAYKALPAKNTLTASDARLVQLAFELRLSALEGGPNEGQNRLQSSVPGADDPDDPSEASSPAREPSSAAGSTERQPGRARSGGIDKSVLSIPEARRYRDKAHLQFVASRPCLVCGRKPADPHHLRFAQVRALGRKVSDEFTVPLCRTHHRELHRAGNEAAWWGKVGIDALGIAGKLWKSTRSPNVSAPSTGAQPGPAVGIAAAPIKPRAGRRTKKITLPDPGEAAPHRA